MNVPSIAAKQKVYEPQRDNITWAAGGAINLELSPKPYTITSMVLVVHPNLTTTTVTAFDDPYDRIISRLNLQGPNGISYFDVTDLRLFQHASRGQLRQYAPKRPNVPANSLTNDTSYSFEYVFHFGIQPLKVNPVSGAVEYDPWDVTGGIPPVGSGNLTLGGNFGAASVMGTNITVNAGTVVDVYFYGVYDQQPMALPKWQSQNPSSTLLSATTSAFQSTYNIPQGDALRDITLMLTNGTNAPRASDVISDLQLWNQLRNQMIFQFGRGVGTAVDARVAYMESQRRQFNGWPPTGTAASPSIAGTYDDGLVYLDLARFGKPEQPYGIDLTNVSQGDLQLRMGVIDATGVSANLLLRKYQVL